MKYFRMSYEEVVFNRSYANIMLLNRSIPSYKANTKDDEEISSRRNIEQYSSEDELFMSLM